jgi:hypothetical protein
MNLKACLPKESAAGGSFAREAITSGSKNPQISGAALPVAGSS